MAKENGWNEKKTGDFNPVFTFAKVGDTIEGKFKGTKFVEKVASNVHTIETKDGEMDIWGTGKLNFLLKDLPVKTMVKVVYKGMVEAKVMIGKKKVNKKVHDFTLFTK